MARLTKTHLIVNPVAGHRDPTILQTVLQSFDRVKAWTTRRAGEAEELARRAVGEGAELIIACGGDATVGEVLNGLADHLPQVRLGLLPLGTGNDFARGLKIPLEPALAVELLREGPTRHVDVVRVHHDGQTLRHFANVAVSGFREETKRRIEHGFKTGWGPLGYLFAAAEAIPEITSYQITLHYSAETVEGLEASVLVVANGGSFGGGIPIVPLARVDDGLLDVLAFRPVTSPGLLLVAPALLRGTHLELEEVYHFQAPRVTIHADPILPFHIDDRFFTFPALTFEILPRALRIIAPQGDFVPATRYGIDVS
jgi:diacylglycerol kinase (ATP)